MRPAAPALALSLFALLAACHDSRDEPSLTAHLAPVPRPDLAGTDPRAKEELDAARARLDQVLALEESTTTELAEALQSAGELYHAYGLLDTALACYRNAALLAPAAPRSHYLLAVVARQLGDPSTATRHLERALELDPADGAALLRLAELRLEAGEAEGARRLYARAREAGETAAALVGLGESSLLAGDPARALDPLEQALHLAPEASRIHTLLADAHRRLGDEEQARHHLALQGPGEVPLHDPVLSEVLQRAAGAGALLRQGDAALLAGRLDEAIAAYRRATEADPESAEAHQSLGAALRRAGDTTAALRSYRRAAELRPDSAAIHSHLAALLAEQRSLDSALEHLERAHALDPTDLELELRLGATLAASGHYRAALPRFRSVIERAPDHVQARLLEATALLFLERDAEARQRLEHGLRRLPDAWPLLDWLARLLATSPDGAVRDGERALALAQRALEDEATLERVETVAMALAELGRFEEAAEWQRRLLEQTASLADPETRQRFEETLAGYQRGEPVRAPWKEERAGAPPVEPPTGAR